MTVQEPQYMTALAEANRIRLENARRRREIHAMPIRDGRDEVADLLLEADEFTLAVPIEKLLGWINRVGAAKVLLVLKVVGVTPGRRVCQLTERQRQVLAAILKSEERLSAVSNRKFAHLSMWSLDDDEVLAA